MPVWERYSTNQTLAALGSHVNVEIFHNTEDTDNFQEADVVGVDGIVTVITNTTDLIGVRLLVLNELITSGMFGENDPAPHEAAVWYSWFAANGPLVFRMRSKKTIPSKHKLWLELWKEQGTASTVVNVGLQVLWVMKH